MTRRPDVTEVDDSPAGRTGFVTVAIPGRERPGEVQVAVRGGTERFIAYSDEPIARGMQVIVVTDRGGRTIDVVSG